MTKICVSSSLSSVFCVLQTVVFEGPSFKHAIITFCYNQAQGPYPRWPGVLGTVQKKHKSVAAVYTSNINTDKKERKYSITLAWDESQTPSNPWGQKQIGLRAGLHQPSQHGDPGRPWAQPDCSWHCCHHLGPLVSHQPPPLHAPEELKSAKII